MTKRRIALGKLFGIATLSVVLLSPKAAHAMIAECDYDEFLDEWTCDDPDPGGGGGGDPGGGVPVGCDGYGGSYDACGVCDGSGSTCGGCDGYGGSYDACGLCDGDGTSCGGGCDGHGGTDDSCGVCDGNNSTCGGCDGVGGAADACGVCDGDGSSCAVDSTCQPSSWTSKFVSSKCLGCEECWKIVGSPDPDPLEASLYTCNNFITTNNMCPVYNGNCCPVNPLPCHLQEYWNGEIACGHIPAAFCE